MPDEDISRSIGRLEGKLDAVVSSMSQLTESFNNLEKGRLSTLEINFAKMQVEIFEKTKNSAAWTSAVVSVIIAVAGAVITYLIIGNGKI